MSAKYDTWQDRIADKHWKELEDSQQFAIRFPRISSYWRARLREMFNRGLIEGLALRSVDSSEALKEGNVKLLATFKDGDTRLLELKPPLKYFEGALMYRIQDATGMEFWFNTADGTFDGTGMSCADCTPEEKEAILQGMREAREGKTKSLDEIESDLAKEHKRIQ